MFGSRYENCASCLKRGDQIRKIHIRPISEEYDLNFLNKSLRKKSTREIIIGIF